MGNFRLAEFLTVFDQLRAEAIPILRWLRTRIICCAIAGRPVAVGPVSAHFQLIHMAAAHRWCQPLPIRQ